jgi:putative hydrolase of the HAD superfamily
MKIKAIIFDIDGTVYSNNWMHICTIPLFLRYGRRLLRFNKARNYLHKHTQAAIAQELSLLEFQGQLMSQFSHGRIDVPTAREHIEIFRSQWEKIFTFIKPYKHFKQCIQALKQDGFKVALFSDFPIYPKVDYLGLGGLWDATLCSEDAGALKPDPAGFLQIAAMLQVSPEEVLFVGNSHKYDVMGAKAAGMHTAHLRFGKAKAHSQADLTFYGYKAFRARVHSQFTSV